MILVTSATRLTGSELVRRLSAKNVPVRALVRNSAKAVKLSALTNVEIVETDMARPEILGTVFQEIDRAMPISSPAPDML